MAETFDAVFDGKAFHPTEPVALEPNTRVRITVESAPPEESAASFLRTARSLQLEGPPDWSTNLHEYLYGRDSSDR